jgi:hypothetical protein
VENALIEISHDLKEIVLSLSTQGDTLSILLLLSNIFTFIFTFAIYFIQKNIISEQNEMIKDYERD